MTAFGKILAILNLIFAIATGALIGMVFLTRTNWQQAFVQVKANAAAADASYKQLLQTESNAVKAANQAKEKANVERDEAKKVSETDKKEIDRLTALVTATKSTNDKDSENVKQMTIELERRRNEVTNLKGDVRTLEVRIRDLEGQLTTVRNEAVTANLQLKTLQDKHKLLLEEYAALKVEIARAQSGGPSAGAKNPPPEQVRGTVKAVDGNLATISVGTDAGVNKDNTLYLYRLTPAPEYLGKLVILSATPFEAVGRIERSRRQVSVRPGDEAAAQIMIKK